MVPVNVGHSHRPVVQQQQICVVTVNANVAILLPVLELLFAHITSANSRGHGATAGATGPQQLLLAHTTARAAGATAGAAGPQQLALRETVIH